MLDVIPLDKNTVISLDKNKPGSAMIVKSNVARSKVPKDIPRNMYKTGQIIEPVLKPQVLAEFLVNSWAHAICVEKKSRMVAGLGIKIISKFDERSARLAVSRYENATPEERKSNKLTPAQYKEAKLKIGTFKSEVERLQAFIDTANDDYPLIEVIKRAWEDWEALGNLNFEILRDSDGDVARMNHVPSVDVRVVQGGEKFCLLIPPYNKPIYFKRFGDPRHLNSVTGEWREWKGEVGDSDFQAGADWGALEATEILRHVRYSSKDRVYGIPTWYSAMADMLGGIESRDFMLRFFSDKAVPMYAVLLEGNSWNEETINVIRDFFRRELPGNYHSTLAIEVPTGGKVTFQQISMIEKQLSQSVQTYQRQTRDVVISVHGMTPAIVGIIESGNLGGGTGSTQMEMVKTTVIKPRQEELEWLFNKFIVGYGLNLKYVMVKFDEVDTQDEEKVQDAVTKLYSSPQRSTITLNEAREMLRKPPIDAEGADKIWFTDPQYGIIPVDDIMGAVRERQKASQLAAAQQGQAIVGTAQENQTPEDEAQVDPSALDPELLQQMLDEIESK